MYFISYKSAIFIYTAYMGVKYLVTNHIHIKRYTFFIIRTNKTLYYGPHHQI